MFISPLRNTEFCSTSLRAEHLLPYILIHSIIYLHPYALMDIYFILWVHTRFSNMKTLIVQHSFFDMRIPGNTVKFCWETKLHGCLEILHIFWEETLTSILLWTTCSRMFGQWTALQGRDSISLQSREQIYLLPYIKDLSFLSSGFLKCDANPLCVWHPFGPLCITPMGLGVKVICCSCSLSCSKW